AGRLLPSDERRGVPGARRDRAPRRRRRIPESSPFTPMALTEFQRTVCRIIARNRIAGGESYVAGGTALNAATAAARISRDIDLFHDTAEAVASSWEADRRLLEGEGYRVQPLR